MESFHKRFLHHKIGSRAQNYQHTEIEGGEKEKIASRFALFAFCIFLEGDKTCERGDECADAADVHRDKQSGVVFGEA